MKINELEETTRAHAEAEKNIKTAVEKINNF